MRWYKDRPEEGDLVVVTITDADKNSAYAELDEYPDIKGLIHISEVSRSWLQDVSKELDEGEKTVAQVIDEEGEPIGLSLKRVNDKQKKDAMERWKKEQKAESFIEELAEELDKDKNEVYEDIVFPMQREFGSSFNGFEISVGEEEKLQDLFDNQTVETVQKIARKNIDLKQEKLEGEIEIKFSQGDGVERIRDLFDSLGEGVDVKYVSAPEYSITAWGRNSRLAKKRMDKAVDNIREVVEKLDGEFDFSKA